jgi:nucleotide-binding universal stress UspA family protein
VTIVLIVLIVLLVLLAAALAVLAGRQWRSSQHRHGHLPGERTRRILFPFIAGDLSRRALDAALRLANAEDAVLVPVFLARVPLHLPLTAPLPRQSEKAMALQEAIEHRAAAFGVPVDARIERGRTNRHALRQTIAQERFDRIVIAAAAHGGQGFDPDDVAWLLDNAEGEIVVLRPGHDDRLNGGPPSLNGGSVLLARRPRRRAGIGAPARGGRTPVAR